MHKDVVSHHWLYVLNLMFIYSLYIYIVLHKHIYIHITRRVAVSNYSSAVENAERSCRYYALDGVQLRYLMYGGQAEAGQFCVLPRSVPNGTEIWAPHKLFDID